MQQVPGCGRARVSESLVMREENDQDPQSQGSVTQTDLIIVTD